jgi:hypothetical protein
MQKWGEPGIVAITDIDDDIQRHRSEIMQAKSSGRLKPTAGRLTFPLANISERW